ncbi:alpha-glucan family phosphorylase [Luteipulveratus halotolerans]|uniref:glycogen phosphorylase n=1 Tax=Luteipulveratus halotolerans TaxID=1631356 RepID=A0A0L6CFP8_9MICO|nr:alpha-glucan family phosphorylase [Luteipulveratus halotolerans]KNX36646.1 glycogen phosphorylase [Luteipulveratus halotolerans]
MKAIRRFHVRTVLPEPLAPLGELATNLRWSWHSRTRDLFRDIDPQRWDEVGHDPVALLASLSGDELDRLSTDEAFVTRVREAADGLRRYLESPQWFQEWTASEHGPAAIAYFSAEFGITSVLPQYSGGLGILAGDHLKSASDLGVPIVGIGLFYKTGYFSQSLSRDGWQQETYPLHDPDNLPLSLVREHDGSPALVSLRLPEGRLLRAHIWKAQVGRVPLLLLDSDVDGNDDAARELTSRLYGGGGDHRLQQELLLGVGGVRALRIWSRLTGAPEPEVYHCNEGHAGFLGVERISELVSQRGLTFDEALEAVRAGTVFTTHTPVPAGIDRFGVDQVQRYLGGDCALPGVPVERIVPLGAEDYDGGSAGIFNMAVMGLRLAQRANGVSQLHGEVSRGMFDGLWPGFDDSEVPIASITNGVHAPTWMDRRVVELAQRHLGSDRVRHEDGWNDISNVPAEDMWHVKREMRQQLVDDVRRRVRDSWVTRGASAAELGWTQEILDPDVLTIGFARRVPTYKRLTLMLRDPARLRRLLLDPDRPVQLVIAGKAHPADDTGKKLIQQMVQFADDPKIRHRIVFLPDYDIAMARRLYPGCDVWLNNPLRPFEACGTSGMKAALNGGLNLSILDGWWDEWYDGHNGWAIPTADPSTGSGQAAMDADRRDDLEAAALYALIENHVAAQFYDRDEQDLPQRWIAMVAHTLRTLGPKVLATRMVRDYVTRLYAPAAHASRARAADDFAQARELASYRRAARGAFGQVHVDHVDSEGVGDAPQVGDRIRVKADVSLGTLAPDDVDVQVVFGRASETDELSDVEAVSLTHAEAYDGSRHRFEGEVTLPRTGAFGYTVRVLPRHPGLASPAELGLVVNA